MSLLLEPNSASTVSGESQTQNHEHDLQSLTWQNIEIDENKKAVLKKAIEDIVNSTDDLPYQIIEAAKVVSKISSGIKAIMIPLRSLVRITDPLLFSCYRTTRRISNGLQAVLRSWSSSFGGHTRNRSINHHWFGHLPSLEKLSIIL